MAINKISGTVFTTGVLIGDTSNNSGASSDVVPTPTVVNNVPVAAALEIQSTTGSLLVPRLTQTQINSLTPVSDGMVVFNTSTSELNVYANGQWNNIDISNASVDPLYNQHISVVTNAYGNNSFGPIATTPNNLEMSQNTTLYFDTTTVNANSKGFAGGIFDGRYVYYVPYDTNTAVGSGQITRYDTTLPFDSASSYAVFDTTTINANSKGFRGAVFDGTYIYYVPHFLGSGTNYSGQVTRYDTRLPFALASSYSIFDTATVQANSKGFYGGVFDGRYVYYVPYFTGIVFNGQITRYDTTLPFASASSYAVFNTATVDANSTGFSAGIFDGRYLYLVPGSNGGGPSGLFTRYDTTQSFTVGGSYAVFDVSVINVNLKNFTNGASFDGRYLYFVTYTTGLLLRYDTTLPFASASSYAFFDTTTVNINSKSFGGMVFDGRYLYLIPYNFAATSGQITRYDTTLPLNSASSYTIFNTTAGNANSKGFLGAVYDGRYIYMVPTVTTSGLVTRINAYIGQSVNAITSYRAPAGMNITGSITFSNTTNTNTLTFNSPAPGSSVSWTLPSADATVVNAPLVSSAAGVLSFNNNAIVSDTTTLNQAQIQNTFDSSIVLIPAPGAGKAIMVVSAQIYINFQTAAFTAGGNMVVQYDSTINGGGINALSAEIPAAQILAASSRMYALNGNTGNALQTITNKGIFASNKTAFFADGNAASTVVITLQYMIVDATV